MAINEAGRGETLEEFVDELQPGQKLMHGQYTIVSFLNAGGFGITYLAEDSFKRPVVIKECFPGSFCRRTDTSVRARSQAHQQELMDVVELFVQEANSLSKLKHPNIVGVHHVFEENNTAYMALDYVEGRDLLDVIEDPKVGLTPQQIEGIFDKVLVAVGFIHESGMLHRDISPDNILLNADMEPILIDFGAAREEASQKSRIFSAMRVVKDGYSPQEFYISGSEQGNFSDLYALGATFYHLVTGQLPAHAQTRLAAIASNQPDPYRAISGKSDKYAPLFLTAIDRALQILPNERFSSADEWASFMAPANVTSLHPNAPAAPTPSQRKKNRTGMLLSSAAVIVFLVVGFWYHLSSESPEELMTASLESDALDGSAIASALNVGNAETGASEAAFDLSASMKASGSEAASALALGSIEAAPLDETADVAQEEGVDATPQDAQSTMSSLLGLTKPAADVALESSYDLSAQDGAMQELPVETNAEQPSLSSLLGLSNLPKDVDAAEPALAPSGDEQQSGAVIEGDAQEDASFASPDTDGNIVLASLSITDDVETLKRMLALPAAVKVNRASDAQEPANPALGLINSAIKTTPLGQIDDGSKSDYLSAWGVELPEALTESNVKVFKVNGLDVAGAENINDALRTNFGRPSSEEIYLTVTSGVDAENTGIQTFIVPVVHTINLSNGIVFEAKGSDGVWTTYVTEVPSNLNTDLRPGDILVSDTASSFHFNTNTALHDFRERLGRKTNAMLALAVQRKDQRFDAVLPNLN